MSSESRSLRGTIVTAEMSVADEDLDTAENALLEALGEVRRRKNTSTEGGSA